MLAMEPQVEDFNAHGREISMMVVSMLQKLEELQDADSRSIALEMESIVEEQHILEHCRQIHDSCK